jgi:CID domain
VHHAKYHTSSLSAFSTFTASIQPFLLDLVQSASAEQHPRIRSRLHTLFDVWEEERFYSKNYANKLQEAINDARTYEHVGGENIIAKDASQYEKSDHAFIMPASHGDPSTPYYDLPAGNLLPLLDPGSSAPIRPEQIRPLRFTAGPADKPLTNALKDFLKEVDSIEHKHKIPEQDADIAEIDELGQITIRGEAGEITGDTYYGWSRAFCEKMKRRKKGQDGDQDRRRSLSRGSSRSSSRSPRKRRRYSDSSRSISRSPSLSRSPPRFRAASPPKLSSEKSREPRMFANESNPFPPPPVMPANLPSNPGLFRTPPLGPNGLPIPPPRPPNWNGPWPPPPPPNVAISGMPLPPPPLNRGSFPPPPPPPGYPGMYNNNYRYQ